MLLESVFFFSSFLSNFVYYYFEINRKEKENKLIKKRHSNRNFLYINKSWDIEDLSERNYQTQ